MTRSLAPLVNRASDIIQFDGAKQCKDPTATSAYWDYWGKNNRFLNHPLCPEVSSLEEFEMKAVTPKDIENNALCEICAPIRQPSAALAVMLGLDDHKETTQK